MMTCVSLRSGVASRGNVTIAHHPATQATAIMDKTASLCFTEKSMTLLIMVLSPAPSGEGHGIVPDRLFAPLGRGVVCGVAINESVAGSWYPGWIQKHAAHRMAHRIPAVICAGT